MRVRRSGISFPGEPGHEEYVRRLREAQRERPDEAALIPRIANPRRPTAAEQEECCRTHTRQHR